MTHFQKKTLTKLSIDLWELKWAYNWCLWWRALAVQHSVGAAPLQLASGSDGEGGRGGSLPSCKNCNVGWGDQVQMLKISFKKLQCYPLWNMHGRSTKPTLRRCQNLRVTYLVNTMNSVNWVILTNCTRNLFLLQTVRVERLDRCGLSSSAKTNFRINCLVEVAQS